jgi:hypothetical protein
LTPPKNVVVKKFARDEIKAGKKAMAQALQETLAQELHTSESLVASLLAIAQDAVAETKQEQEALEAQAQEGPVISIWLCGYRNC